MRRDTLENAARIKPTITVKTTNVTTTASAMCHLQTCGRGATAQVATKVSDTQHQCDWLIAWLVHGLIGWLVGWLVWLIDLMALNEFNHQKTKFKIALIPMFVIIFFLSLTHSIASQRLTKMHLHHSIIKFIWYNTSSASLLNRMHVTCWEVLVRTGFESHCYWISVVMLMVYLAMLDFKLAWPCWPQLPRVTV